MANNIVRVWNSRLIRHRADGYMSLTDMAQANGKLFADWMRLKSTNEYLQELEAVMGIPITELIEVKQGGTPEEQGTWGHRRVSVRFAQWCSAKFAVQVDAWVEELMTTGSVSILPDATPISLPPADIRLHQLTNSLQFLSNQLGADLSNPRYQQELRDYALNLIVGEQKQIAAAEVKELWCGVVEIAIDMGYQASLVNKHRSQLGKFVASFGYEMRKEKRLCNGAMYPINLYLDCEELRNTIAEFMDAKVLSQTI